MRCTSLLGVRSEGVQKAECGLPTTLAVRLGVWGEGRLGCVSRSLDAHL